MLRCVICNKKLSKDPFSKKKKFEILNNEYICRGCAFRIGITNKVDAATYTAQKAREEFIELYPAKAGICRGKTSLNNDYIGNPADDREKDNAQKNGRVQPKTRKKRGFLVALIIFLFCFVGMLVLGSVVQREDKDEILSVAQTWINNLRGNFNAAVNRIPSITEGKKWIEEKLDIGSDDDPVELYCAVLDFEGAGAEAFLAKLREDNPEKQYRYFNEQYYILITTEGERKAALEQLRDVNSFFNETFAEDYPGLFIKAELNKNMDKLTLHVNREVYETNLLIEFPVMIVGSVYMDELYACNLVPPEDREIHIVCVDESGEVLMDSDTWEEPEEESAVGPTFANNVEYPLNDYVVVDNEHCMFTVKSIEPAGDWGFTVNVCCENKTDKKLMFSWNNVSVMGFMADPFWAKEVAAGKKANTDISFSHRSLERIGIESVDDITFVLKVSESDNWSVDPILEKEYSIYPTGKSIQDISYPERRNTDTEVILYDNDEYSVVILSNRLDNGEFLMDYYLENKTGHTIQFSMDDVSVNGYMVEPFWATSVVAGKKKYSTVDFSESQLKNNGVETVEEVEFALRVTNVENWDTHATEVFNYIP